MSPYSAICTNFVTIRGKEPFRKKEKKGISVKKFPLFSRIEGAYPAKN
jgi:hypothetical protein